MNKSFVFRQKPCKKTYTKQKKAGNKKQNSNSKASAENESAIFAHTKHRFDENFGF